MKFTPLGERVLVQRLEEDTKTSSGIIIPDNAKEKPLMGTIKALGDKATKECPELKKDQVVVFEKYKGNAIKLDNQEFIVLEVKDILGIITK